MKLIPIFPKPIKFSRVHVPHQSSREQSRRVRQFLAGQLSNAHGYVDELLKAHQRKAA